jgi:hypothetical protein
MLALNLALPKRVLDLYVENRWLYNIQESGEERKRKTDEKFFSLVTTLRRFGCDSMAAEEKEAMVELILRGGVYTEQQKLDILAYCESDVDALDALLPKMLPKLDIRRAVARGSYVIEIARIEDRGVPIDAERLGAILARRDELILHLISQHPHIDVYEGTKLDQEKFEAFLAKNNLASQWRKTRTGIYSSDDDYLEEMGEIYPAIEEFRQLKKTVLQLQRDRFRAGVDGRARCDRCNLRAVGADDAFQCGERPHFSSGGNRIRRIPNSVEGFLGNAVGDSHPRSTEGVAMFFRVAKYGTYGLLAEFFETVTSGE